MWTRRLNKDYTVCHSNLVWNTRHNELHVTLSDGQVDVGFRCFVRPVNRLSRSLRKRKTDLSLWVWVPSDDSDQPVHSHRLI